MSDLRLVPGIQSPTARSQYPIAITNNYLHTTSAERRAAVNSMSYAVVMGE